MKYCLISYKKDSNIGIFINTNNKITLAPKDFEKVEKIEETLKTKVLNTTIWDSSLIGLYTAMNDNGILLPKFIYSEEFKKIKKEIKDLNIQILNSDYNALSNLILCNNKAALVSPLIEKENLKVIKDVLDVEVEQRNIDNFELVGSIARVTNKGLIAYRDISEESFNFLKDFFKVGHISIGTVNFGNIFVSIGIVANDNGVLIGEKSSPYEIERILEALGFV